MTIVYEIRIPEFCKDVLGLRMGGTTVFCFDRCRTNLHGRDARATWYGRPAYEGMDGLRAEGVVVRLHRSHAFGLEGFVQAHELGAGHLFPGLHPPGDGIQGLLVGGHVAAGEMTEIRRKHHPLRGRHPLNLSLDFRQ